MNKEIFLSRYTPGIGTQGELVLPGDDNLLPEDIESMDVVHEILWNEYCTYDAPNQTGEWDEEEECWENLEFLDFWQQFFETAVNDAF